MFSEFFFCIGATSLFNKLIFAAHFLLSVTSAPGGCNGPKCLPTSVKNETQEQVSTLQMFRVVGKRNSNAKSPQAVKPNSGESHFFLELVWYRLALYTASHLF